MDIFDDREIVGGFGSKPRFVDTEFLNYILEPPFVDREKTRIPFHGQSEWCIICLNQYQFQAG